VSLNPYEEIFASKKLKKVEKSIVLQCFFGCAAVCGRVSGQCVAVADSRQPQETLYLLNK
jgi:hypothetical protein